MSLVRRYPLTAFFVLACALSWWPWILYSVGLLPNPIVDFGPFLAALVVLAAKQFDRYLRRPALAAVANQLYASLGAVSLSCRPGPGAERDLRGL